MGIPSPVGVESYTEEPVSQMRKVIAKRLGESKFAAPHFYLTMEIDMDEAIKSREAINLITAVKISFNDLVINIHRNCNWQPRNYSVKAKDKKLQPSDWEGNTFTISNLGMFGIEEFTAIINPPDACILAVGGIKQTPVVKNNQIIPGNVMKVTLSCDHRVVDGALGSAFLKTLKHNLENPVLMLGGYSI